jgi:cytoskeletal protein CcmA (bactofilin family)
MQSQVLTVGKSVVFKGTLSAQESLTLDGHVEGTIEAKDHSVTIGPHARIHARIVAKVVTVLGNVVGQITAAEKIELRPGASVEGDIVAPRIAMLDGARLQGKVEMPRTAQPAAELEPLRMAV